uniref:Leucine-rich repeat-containing protein 34 n=1 Tax=Mesocestoides corti TaxID=53468 RepID=A0A5K3FIQ1_MESCO
MIDKRLICLQQLIESYQNSQYDPTEDGPRYILKMMRKEYEYNKSLEEIKWIYLKVCGNNFRETCYRLRDREIPSLCASLLNVPVINSLDLRYNELTNEGAITLGNFLKNDRCLKELNLMGNNITADGAKELGIALKLNHTLKILKMTGNPIKREGGIHLAHGLQANNTLTHLDVGECDMSLAEYVFIQFSVFSLGHRQRDCVCHRPANKQLTSLFQHQQTPVVHASGRTNGAYVGNAMLEHHPD